MKRMRKWITVVMAMVLAFTLMIPVAPVQAAKKIQLNKSKVELSVGEKVSLKLKNATSADVKWSTSNKSIATVTSKGKVTAKKAGSVTITAKYDAKKYTCKVTVKSSEGSVEVYLTETGTKYHCKNNCGTTDTSKTTKVTEEEAIALGYTKCGRCYR